MKKLLFGIACGAMVLGGANAALAGGRYVIEKGTTTGPVTVTGSTYSGVTNRGRINGGSSTGLTVSGTAAESVINEGEITSETVGVSIQATTGTSTFVNTGTVSVQGTSSAVGVRVSP